ncbi:MAG: hypothetical protein GX663_01170 [Clostridiales bacterium]|nr:hypothetical protein [Clostridiales bacterium]
MRELSSSIAKTGTTKFELFPFMQINSARLKTTIAIYINSAFNPMVDNNWRVLLINSLIIEHIIKELSMVLTLRIGYANFYKNKKSGYC